MKTISRRNFFGKMMALPAGLWMSNFDTFRESSSAVNQVKITAIKVIQLDFEHDGCLLKIETDAGLVGYGETGVTSRVARAFLQGRNSLIGADPLSIRTLYHKMTTPVHPLFGPMPLISGIDIALWDLAGKILNQPVYKLLGGPFRDGCPMYSHGSHLKDMLDPGACRSWADYIKQNTEGFRAFKLGPPFRLQMPYHPTITTEELKLLDKGFSNIREAVGDSAEIGLHLHNELDTYSGIAMANTCKPYNIVYIEDPLNAVYSDGWVKLKEDTGVPVMTGEKLFTFPEFKTFLDSKAVDIIHPDISFAGGFTGCMRIADYAATTRTPLALHNVGTIVRTYASAHLSMAIQNFYKSESDLGEPGRGNLTEQMSPEPPVVRDGILHVPDRPGLGLILDDGFLKKHLIKDEPWWG